MKLKFVIYVIINFLMISSTYCQINDIPESLIKQILESGLSVKQLDQIAKDSKALNNTDVQSSSVGGKKLNSASDISQSEIQQKLDIINQKDGVVNETDNKASVDEITSDDIQDDIDLNDRSRQKPIV